MIEALKNNTYTNVWIYGAGKVGKKLWNAFHFLGIRADGFVVSKYDGVRIFGAEVRELQNIVSAPAETLFIVTVPEKFREEVVSNLEAREYANYIVWDERCLSELWQMADHSFEDRRKKTDKCCFILAGYKEFLWDKVFGRIETFIPADVDVCIISSGVYNERLSDLAKKNGWSYLATKVNSVTLVQNVAFAIYQEYEWVYKIDEDIFVTEGSFEQLMQGYSDAVKNLGYEIGITVPLIPINGYGYKTILDKYCKSREYEEKFGPVKIGGNPESEIEKNPESAVFMWSELPALDEMNRDFQKEKPYSVCGVRFSIGFILLKHTFWDDMQGFAVSGTADMGADEEEVCANCINGSKAIIVCHHAVVGHFSFGRQTNRMKEYFILNPKRFDIV